MISIIQHIEYLMMYHDCVVVPGWGALIANYASSSVGDGKIARPNRLIGFNSNISHNDGMLATSLMRRHGLGYEQACTLIADNVTTFRRHIASGADLSFGRLGYFRLSDQEKLEFVPMTQLAACDEFFGLENVSMLTIDQLQKAGSDATVLPPVTVSWRERMKVAASIAAIMGVGLLLSTPIIIDKSTQTASLNIAEVKSPMITTPQVTMKPAAKTTAKDLQFAVIDEKGVEKTISPVATTQEVSQGSLHNEDIHNSGNLLLVIKACDSNARAESKARHYTKRGIKTWIVCRDGKYNIVVAQSDNEKELKRIKKTLPSKCKHAWIVE